MKKKPTVPFGPPTQISEHTERASITQVVGGTWWSGITPDQHAGGPGLVPSVSVSGASGTPLEKYSASIIRRGLTGSRV